MKIRILESKDASFMLEWMHDENVINGLQATLFRDKQLNDALQFIKDSIENSDNVHFAICSDDDEYLGTVSLKHCEAGRAEFAIVTRTKGMGTGASSFGMLEILRYGFEIMHLREIYWQVLKSNKRAIAFYNKLGFKSEKAKPYMVKYYSNLSDSPDSAYLWYRITLDEYQKQ